MSASESTCSISPTFELGSSPTDLRPDKIRIASLNVGNLPVDAHAHDCTCAAISWMQALKSKLFGWSEIGVNFFNQHRKTNFHQMIRHMGWTGVTIQASNCHNTSTSRVQAGGVALFVHKDWTHLIDAKGRDPTGLGRWVWVQLCTSTGAGVQIYQLYRCIFHPLLELLVYRQQRNFLLSHRDSQDPRQALLEDLTREIQALEEMKILVMGDFNEDIQSTAMQDWSAGLGLHETTLLSIGSPRGTHRANRSNCQINSLFSDVVSSTAGLTNFGLFDHRTLWMTLSLTTAFGFQYVPPRPRVSRCLRFSKPTSVEKYHVALSEAIGQTDLYRKVQRVTMQTPLHVATSMLNHLDSVRCQIMLEAEKKCAHVSKGKVPYSPMVGLLRKKIYVTKLIRKKLSGPSHISS